MNKLPAKIITSLLFAAFALAVPVTRAFATPSITLDPNNITVAQNAQFTVSVKINADATNVMGADATIKYAGADLEFVSASSGNYFPVFTSANDAAGTLELHSYTLSSLENHSGAGTLATVVFKAKKGSGSSNMSFSCTGNGHDTDIRSTDGQNILNCTNVNQSGIAYTGTPTSTLTPTATTAPGNSPTHTPTPTTPPTGGGSTTPQCASLYSDISMAVGTPQAVTLTCSGIYSNGYINAAEFNFGDGTKQTVEKNAGSPGSIATTHTYTTIGSLGVTCRVRNNDNVWSSIPENCNKVITIKPKSATATPTPTSATYAYGGSSPTPTPVVVSIVSDTPLPTQGSTTTPEPTLYPGSPDATGTSEAGSGKFWWIVGGIIAVILAFLLLRRREPQQPPVQPPPPMQPMQPPVQA